MLNKVEVPMKSLQKLFAAVLLLSPVSVIAAASDLAPRETQIFAANGRAVLIHFQYYQTGVINPGVYPEGCKVIYQFPQFAPIEVVLSAKEPMVIVDKSLRIGCKLDKQSPRVTVSTK